MSNNTNNNFMSPEGLSREYGLSNQNNNFSEFSYLQRELFHNYNISIENAENFLPPLAKLLDKANYLKREKEEAEKKTKRAESELKDLQRNFTKLQNDHKILADGSKNKEKSLNIRIEELEKENLRQKAKISSFEKEIGKQKKDDMTKYTAFLKEGCKSNFLVTNKQPASNDKDIFTFADVIKENTQVLLDNYTKIITSLFGFFDNVNNTLFSLFATRKLFLAEENNSEEQNLATLPVWNRLSKINVQKHSRLEIESVEEIGKNFNEIVLFLDNFDELISAKFRQFASKRKNKSGKSLENFDLESIFRTKNFAKIKEVVELQKLLENYNNIVEEQKRLLELNKPEEGLLGLGAIGPEEDEDKNPVLQEKLISKTKGYIEDIDDFLKKQRIDLENVKLNSQKNSDMIHQEISTLKNTASLY